jgi:hypothetical protein
MKGKKERICQNSSKVLFSDRIEERNKVKECRETLNNYVLRPIPIDLRSYKLKTSGDNAFSNNEMNDSLCYSNPTSKNNSKNKSMPQVNISNTSVVFTTAVEQHFKECTESKRIDNTSQKFNSIKSTESNATENTSQKNSSWKSEQSDIKAVKNSENKESDNELDDLDNFNLIDEEEMKDFPDGEGLEFNVDSLRVNDYIYDGSIKIIKYISEGAQAKIYLGLIEEIEKYVAVKRYTLPKYDSQVINKIKKENEILRSLENEYIVKYFDVDYTTESETEVTFKIESFYHFQGLLYRYNHGAY